jgi:N-acyl-L-homoserine lactone synthetase
LGFVGAFEVDGELIGTIRLVPMGHGLTLTDQLVEQLADAAPQVPGTRWEVGRLVLGEAHRTDVDALRRCLFLSLDYASRQTEVHHLFASCSHVLSRLYRRFAFAPFAANVPLQGTAKSYTLIHGRAHDVLQALGRGKALATALQ